MKTINAIMDQFTNPETIYNDLLETLREVDPNYADEEARFIAAISCLKEELNEAETLNFDTYLNTAQEEIAAIMVYTSWLGFQLNLDCWKNPVNKLMLDQDYEEITQERTFDSILTIKMARKQVETAAQAIPNDHFSDICSYFSYLHTMAPKLAHLYGFRLADKFLYNVIPGYISDSLTTQQYVHNTQDYLGLQGAVC